MEQFSLEEYLTNPSRKVITKGGKDVRIICTDRRSTSTLDGPIIALIDDKELGKEHCYTYSPDGKAFENIESEIDLFFAPVKKTGWMNVYKTPAAGCFADGSLIFRSEKNSKRVNMF